MNNIIRRVVKGICFGIQGSDKNMRIKRISNKINSYNEAITMHSSNMPTTSTFLSQIARHNHSYMYIYTP